MSDWECKEMIYELKSPVHIGKGQTLGIIDRTRYYIPGKTMWGAAVAKIGKEKGMENDQWDNLGKFVKNHMKFTYFYILDEEKGELIPNYTESSLKYGKPQDTEEDSEKGLMGEKEFERTYITSFASAAVEKEKGTAAEGDLHEIELIKNRRGPKEEDKVYIKGYMFIDGEGFEAKGYDEKKFLEWIKNLQIGGERNYGYGKLKLANGYPKENQNKIFGNKISMNSEEIMVENNENEITAFGHLIVKDKNDKSHLEKLKDIRGDLEPLVGREWTDSPGKKPRFNGIGLKPGSKFRLSKTSEIEISPGKKLNPEDYNAKLVLGKFGCIEVEK